MARKKAASSSDKQKITVLSVRQPFASWIIHADKWCENRVWPPPGIDGTIYIHASSWEPGTEADARAMFESPDGYPTGAIIGSVLVLDACTVRNLENIRRAIGAGRRDMLPEEDDQRLYDFLSEQPAESWQHVSEDPETIAWILANPEPLRVPLACKGKLKLWTHTATLKELAIVRQSAIMPST